MICVYVNRATRSLGDVLHKRVVSLHVSLFFGSVFDSVPKALSVAVRPCHVIFDKGLDDDLFVVRV